MSVEGREEWEFEGLTSIQGMFFSLLSQVVSASTSFHES